MPISYTKVIAYLDAVADKGLLDVANSPHGRFWTGMTHDQFVKGVVPNVLCKGQPIPIIDQSDLAHDSAANSSFLVALINTTGFCKKKQMPKTGPFITDAGYTVTLSDGSVVSGSTIESDILDWLKSGFPA